jgi:hypothetical protein
MDTENILQLLVNMGSELDLNPELYTQYEPLRQLGLVIYRDDKIYKTDKGRKACANPQMIRG